MKTLVALFLAIWAVRLASYLWRRAKHGEDSRYAALKEQWGEAAPLLLGAAGFADQFLLLFLVTVIRFGQLGSTRRKWGRRPRVRQRWPETVRYAGLAANCRICKNTTFRPSPTAKALG